MKHGGDPGLLYSHMKEPWLDLSTGINPWGYPWLERMNAQEIFWASSRLPTAADYNDCQKAYARYLGGAAEHITLAPGSQALIECLPTLFEKQTVYIAGPTYSEHEICWRRAGHDVRIFQDMAELNSIGPGEVAIFCAPNNPDGQHPDIVDFMHRHTATGGYVIIDEAFADLIPERSLIGSNLPENVIILRSFGKFFGLAGVRIGVAYTKGPIKIPSGLWHISTLSLLIATRALVDRDWITQTRRILIKKMAELTRLFKDKGHKVIGQTDLFCLVEGPEEDRLLRAGIFARSFEDKLFENGPLHDRKSILRFGLPPTKQDFQKLEEQL